GTVTTSDCPNKLNEADTPLNWTAVTVSRFPPVIVRLSPGRPRSGVMAEIVGAPDTLTVKLPAVAADPAQLSTVIVPEAAPGGTSTVIVLPKSVKLVVTKPLKLTRSTVSRFRPLMATEVPTGPT